jgi:hypothetical protein
MIAMFSLKTLFQGVPPPLLFRAGVEFRENALSSQGIQIDAAQSLDGDDWSAMSMNISNASRAGLYSFLQTFGCVAVTVQSRDLGMLIGNDLFRTAIAANFSMFAPQLTNLPPDQLFDTLEQIAMVVLKYQPEEKNAPDPFYRESNEDRQRKQIEDETFMELHAQQEATEKEAMRVTVDGFWSE